MAPKAAHPSCSLLLGFCEALPAGCTVGAGHATGDAAGNCSLHCPKFRQRLPCIQRQHGACADTLNLVRGTPCCLKPASWRLAVACITVVSAPQPPLGVGAHGPVACRCHPRAYRREELACRFCKQILPDWRSALTPPTLPQSNPVMAIVYNGRVVRLQVKPGKDGQEDFKSQIRKIFELPDDVELDCTFDCR